MPNKSRYNSASSGKVNYGHSVIVSIISLATMEIRGVSSLVGKKVKTVISGKEISVEVFIRVEIGFSCAEVAYRVQENIKRSVEGMTSYRIVDASVHVHGVCFENK